jgi:phage-related protein
MTNELSTRPLLWVASSKRDLMEMPDEPRREFGHGLHVAQLGKLPKSGKPLTGFGGISVMELVEDHESSTYRAVYTVRYPEVVAVLHVFQKKSKQGKKTDKKDIDLIKSRLKIAEEMYIEWKRSKKK